MVRARPALALVLLLAAAPVAAWEAPDHWGEVGDVAGWLERDAAIYRLVDDMPFLDRSQQGVDQQAAYADTRRHADDLPPLDLAAFLALPPDARAARIDAAASHRDFVVRFRVRMDKYVHEARANQALGWGRDVADVRVVGECLRHLQTVVGLDPADPTAWHLYAMFAGLVGDLERAGAALAGAEAALAEVPDGELADLRRAVALDAAWNRYDRGDLAAARAGLDRALDLGAHGVEAVLLSGLIAARTGDEDLATRQAAKLGAVEVRRFPPRYRETGWSPEISNLGAWRAAPSDYARAWIMTTMWLHAGDLEMARLSLGTYDPEDVRPLGWRFWDEAGQLYAMTGRPQEAARAATAARIWRPYAPFFPVKIHEQDTAALTGLRGERTLYRAFDRFLVAGGRLADALRYAEQVPAAPDDLEAQAAAGRALDAAARCRATGVFPAQTHVVAGAVYHRMGDAASAAYEVQAALELLARPGDAPGEAALLRLLGTVRTGDDGPLDLAAFYGQAGSQGGRWAADADPEATERALREAYRDDSTDANRRALARFLVRQGRPGEGRELVSGDDAGSVEDLVLRLEADRALGDAARARALVEQLAAQGDALGDARVWTLAGFICLDDGHEAAARRALERALELDPGNHALQVQLELLGRRS